MTRITLDDALRKRLLNLSQPLEVCDEAGHLVARVIPILDPNLWGPLEPQVSDEELERRSRSNKWHTTQEVLAHLKRLESQ